MQYRTSFNINTNKSPNPFSSLVSILMFIGVLVVLFFLLKGLVTVLYWVTPVLLVATLIINYRIVVDYFVSLFETFQTDILMGMLKVVFTLVCYPIVIGWLFIKALFYRKMDTVKQQFDNQIRQRQGEYAEFEEISTEMNETKPEQPTIIELPKPKEKEKNNPYDTLFDS